MSQTIASGTTTCATCPYFESFNERSGRGHCKLFDKVAREHHATTQDCVNTIAETAQEETAPEPIAIAASDIEVDSDIDPDFGTIYRVWQSYCLLGTFYQDLDYKWVAQPVGSDFRPRLNTPEQAQLVIIASYYSLAAA